MTKKTSNLLLIGFFIGFFIIGYIALTKAMPEEKNERVYALLQPYFPYELEQRLGGFTIVYKLTGDKEKPPASEVFKRVDELDKAWGKEFLSVKNNQLNILDKEKKIIATITLQNKAELEWVKQFFNK